MRLGEKQMRELERALDHRRSELDFTVRSSAALRAVATATATGGDDVPEAPAADAEASSTIEALHAGELRDIAAAHTRMLQGTYGRCVDCSHDIAFPRLQAYPTAKRCLPCQEAHERRRAI